MSGETVGIINTNASVAVVGNTERVDSPSEAVVVRVR